MSLSGPVAPERLKELRDVLGRIDPSHTKIWILEVYDRRDGKDKLSAIIDIQTGQLLPHRQKASGAVPIAQGGEND